MAPGLHFAGSDDRAPIGLARRGPRGARAFQTDFPSTTGFMRDRAEEKSRTGGAERPDASTPDREAAAAGSEPGAEPPEAAEGAAAEAGRAEELMAELDALRDRYLRTVAEFENFRRRTERERAEGGVRAQAQVVGKLLDALDDLERVADFTAETTTVEALLEGVQMVERKLLRSLEGAGLERIEARGQAFDPTRHEALMTGEAGSAEEDETVGAVLQPGYLFQGILLRPARVQVMKFGE